VNEYKYLGVYFSRSLKLNYHINSYVKENADQKLNYCIRILGEHGNFNRLCFWDALWHSVLRPSVSHGGSVWFPSSVGHVESLESIQYKMAKLIMNTRMNILKSALFLELGWEPVYIFMNRQGVAYYARFQNMADDRLCKIILNMLRNSENSEYHTYFKNLFIDLD
jgi:hypothetical protein